MRLHCKAKQFCIAFVFALAIGFTIPLLASAITSHAPATTSPAPIAPAAQAPAGPSIAGEPPNLPRGYALVAGINDYPGTGNDLTYCVPDANGVADMLKNNGFAPANVYTLLDCAATETGISAKVSQIATLMDANDVFVMYYSGHGSYVATGTAPASCNIHTPHPYSNYYYNYWTIHHEGALGIRVQFTNFNTESGYDVGFVADRFLYGYGYSGNRGTFWSSWVLGDTCLVGLSADNIYTYYGFDVTAYEIITGMDTSLVTYDFATNGGMYGTELNASLAGLPAGSTQFLAFDSCMSGGMLAPLNAPNRAVMSACAASEYSIESPSLGHGVFTYYFLQSFAKTGNSFTYDTDHDGNVTVSEMHAYAAPLTTSFAAGSDSDQHPQLSNNLPGTGAWDLDADNDGLYNWQETDVYHSNPLSTDSDGDGLLDGVEVNTHHTSPLLADTDGDNLGDYAEIVTHHTNPAMADSDADGLADGAEVTSHHTNPLQKDTDGDGLLDGPEVNTYHTDPLKQDTDGDTLSDGKEVTTYHTDPTKKDTDGDGFTDDYEVKAGWDPLSGLVPWGSIAGAIVTAALVTAGSIGYHRYRKAHPAAARSRPWSYFPRATPATDTAIVSSTPSSPFVPAYHAPNAAGRLVPTFKSHDADWWGMLAQALEQRGYWNDALAAAEVARQLRRVEMNPPAWTLAENEGLMARRTPSCPRCGYPTPNIICPNCGAVTDRRPSLPTRATTSVATPAIDTFLAEPAQAEEITIDKSEIPAPQDLQPIPAPETPLVDVMPAPVEGPVEVPPIPDPNPVLGLPIEPVAEIIPLCRLCGGLVKGGECERCGAKVCPACKGTSYATATFCVKCRTPF